MPPPAPTIDPPSARHAGPTNLVSRVDACDWAAVARALDEDGHARLPALLPAERCDALRALYDDDARFRSRVVMARHGFGRGEYKYLAYPLPDDVQALRTALYRHLAPIATAWFPALKLPPDHGAFLRRCHAAGQTRPTPLLLRYEAGDYNCLHQDLYGEHVFPLQVVVMLSRPGADFDGGELVVTQTEADRTWADVIALAQGDAAVVTTDRRPARGPRGRRLVAMRHGVSVVRDGRRATLGVILHDAA